MGFCSLGFWWGKLLLVLFRFFELLGDCRGWRCLVLFMWLIGKGVVD